MGVVKGESLPALQMNTDPSCPWLVMLTGQYAILPDMGSIGFRCGRLVGRAASPKVYPSSVTFPLAWDPPFYLEKSGHKGYNHALSWSI